MKSYLILLTLAISVFSKPSATAEQIAPCPRGASAYIEISAGQGTLYAGDSMHSILDDGDNKEVSYVAKIKDHYPDLTSVSAAIFDREYNDITLYSGRIDYRYDNEGKLANVKQAPGGMSPKLAFWWKKATIVLVDGEKTALLNKNWESFKDSSLEAEIRKFLRTFSDLKDIKGIIGAGEERATAWMKDGMQTWEKSSDGSVETIEFNWPSLVDYGWTCTGE